MAKRRLISLLPAFNQTTDLSNFFGSTVDEVFQPGISDSLSGYIGRVPSVFDPATDFYVGEPTKSRAAYQLEAGMISLDSTGNVSEVLSYPDFIGYLNTSGADISNHQRLFETECYSWAPPINIDMISNFRNYYWFGDHSGSADLPTLVLTIPTTTYTGDGSTTTFALPASINAIASVDETPAVFVNNLPVAFIVSGNNVILGTAPSLSDAILVARTPDFASAISGMLAVDVSDINLNGVSVLTSTMRIKIIDAMHIIGGWDAIPWDSGMWDLAGIPYYMVDGVGAGIRLTPDDAIVSGLSAQYVTIDRSSSDFNLWSLHNSWVHKDSFGWSGLEFPQRQAVRPIIEFIRDIVLFPNVVWSESSDPLFMLYDIDNVALNDPGRYPASNFNGNRIFGYVSGTGPIDTVLARSISYDNNGYPVFQNDAFAIQYKYGDTPITSHYCYATDVRAEALASISGTTMTDTTPLGGMIQIGQTVYGAGIAPNTTIIDFGTGSGETGTYIVSNSQTVTSEIMTFSDMSFSSLWHQTVGTTTQGIVNGFYSVPKNLEANPLSDDVRYISRSTWLTHFESIISAQTGLTGNPLGDNNYRDTPRDLSYGSSILQHRAPLLKAMLTASDRNFDVPQTIRYIDGEYNRFRNKFVRKLIDINNKGALSAIDPVTSPDVWVVEALNQIKRDKTINFPFALSIMGGGQYFIPATPASMGILPVAVPTMVTDSTYQTAVIMIQGHDGSFTPSFGDWRDNVMLALEQRIYDNLPTQFKTEARPVFDIARWIGGRFFAPYNGYSQLEVNQIIGPMFELWAQLNRFDYRTNTGYDPNDPFTWNFNGVSDIFGNILPGNWRAIYRWYYGSDSPHTRPWEMLGFVSEPTWWVSTYGVAPYTRGNTALWTDLENGVIAGGPRMGYDNNYARPGLQNLIPVDHNGNLLNPIQTGIVNYNIPASIASRPWVPGDHGPAENLWMNSPSYRYALSAAAFLMKPARFMEECWDTLRIEHVGTQWVDTATLYRPLDINQYIHGETKPDGSVAVNQGVQQWISDYIVSSGKKVSLFGNAIRGLDVRLLHQMAGFVSSNEIKAVADSFGLLPSEDVNAVLYTSPSTSAEVYSGVILEWTGRSWRVIGYDSRNPFFTIIPPDTHSSKGLISLASASEPSIVQWHANTYYPINILVDYQSSVYQCIRSHTSGPVFESVFWQARPDLSTSMIRAPRVFTYSRGLPTIQTIPYGTELFTYQEIADFLLGLERWLVGRGWIFDNIDQTSGEILNWSLSVKEFLTWAQIQWQPGNFIALSPGQQGLKFSTSTGIILNVENNITGYFGLIDRSGQPIRQRDAIVDRIDGEINLSANNADVFAARLEIAEIEHVLVFSNITIFDDNIYLPLFDTRQLRLRLICNRSQNWQGRLDAPGYVIVGNQLKSNFEKAANDVRLMFDIELADVINLRNYARHNVAFQERSYLNNLLLSDTEQFEFYQGMIQAKGSPGVFEKLMRSQRVSSNSNLQFLEEWAFRIGRYGAPLDPLITFQLTQTDYRDDPQIIRFNSMTNAPLDWIIMPLSDSRWFDKPRTVPAFFPQYRSYVSPALPTAGPVRLDDVKYTTFNLAGLTDLYSTELVAGNPAFSVGSRTWVYERADGTFTVLESFETGTLPNPILKTETSAEDISITKYRIYFQNTLTATISDVGNYLVIDGQSLGSPELQGVQKITAIDLLDNYIEVDLVGTQGHDFTSSLTSAPFVRILREVRFANMSNLTSATYVWLVGDLAWIDNYSGQWAVVQWDGSVWNVIRNKPYRINTTEVAETVIYSEGVRLTGNEMIVHEPVVPVLDVIDPLSGLLTGVSAREITYQVAYDPARYTSGAASPAVNPWGKTQLGQVWFDISTIKFLEPYTDIMGVSPERDLAELSNRLSSWNKIAPKSSVDVYEWSRSITNPANYAANGSNSGTVYNKDNPSWVEVVEFDNITGKQVTAYYFWIKGLTVTPDVSFRKIDISTVALGIQNPAGLDIPWLAPIAQDTLIVGGVHQYLNDVNTVLKVRLDKNLNNPGVHDEWVLLRPTDETSLPPDSHITNLRQSLATFDDYGRSIPYPNLAPTRNTGVNLGQNMFVIDGLGGIRSGLLDARRAFVQSVNNIFASTAVAVDRQTYISTIIRSSVINANLIWAQANNSYPYEAPPANEWDVEVFTIDHRNQLLARPDFLAAVSQNRIIRVLLNSVNNPSGTRGWSVWNFNPITAASIIASNPLLNPAVSMLLNANIIFELAKSYEHSVTSISDRNNLIVPVSTINIGDRILVTNDSTATGFWTIWRYVSNTGNPDIDFILWRTQRYRTTDFFSYVDWYANGYNAFNPPIVTYSNILTRDITEGSSPINTFVKILDDGTPAHSWIWTTYQNGAWLTVAIENGTISLSKEFYNSSRVFQDFKFGKSISFNTSISVPSGHVLTFSTTSGVQIGQSVYGSNIPSGTKVVSLTGTTVTLNNDITNFISVASEVLFVTVGNVKVSDVAVRDGSWELNVLVQSLRYGGILLDSEINQIWFDIVNFCHVQQPDIDWAFKTSFMSIVGYNVPLEQTPFKSPDQTDSLVSYVDEVKPYHVKIREFSTQYSTKIDQASMTATDFNKPVYYDEALARYRVLDPIADAAILATLPWDYWTNNYALTKTPVRGIDVELIFDRYAANLSAWDAGGWDSDTWDEAEQLTSLSYVHTFVSDTLTMPGTSLKIDDVRYFADKTPCLMNLNGNTYIVLGCTIDINNGSTTNHGSSGVIITSTNISVLDGTSGNMVEIVLPILGAAARISSYYNPVGEMPPNDPVLLMDLDYKAEKIVYVTTTDVIAGATILTFASTSGVAVGQPISGPGIVKGTYGTNVTSTTITLSRPITHDTPAGSMMTLSLPNWIDSYILQTFTPPVSDFDMFGFDLDGFDTTTDIYDIEYDGDTLTPPSVSVSINPPLTSRPDGFGFVAPYYTPKHPQERIPFVADDGLRMVITAGADVGGPPQIIKTFDVSGLSGPTATLFIDMIPRSSDDLMVFFDGVRGLLNTDYTVDYLGRTITANVTGISSVSLHAYSFGGISAINEQQYLDSTGNGQIVVLDNASTHSQIAVISQGIDVNPANYTVTGNNLTVVTNPYAGTDLAVIRFDGTISDATKLQYQPLVLPGPTWVAPTVDSIPPHIGTIVEVNGRRLAPITTWFGIFTEEDQWMYLPIPPDNTTTVTVYVDGVLYTTPIPFATGTTPLSPYPFKITGFVPPPMVSGRFVFFGNIMISLDPTFVSNDVVVVLGFVGITPDYDISGGNLTINTVLNPGDKPSYTCFTNDSSMGLKTVVYPVSYSSLGEYPIPTPFAKDYLLVTMDGLELSPDFDYEVIDSAIGWDAVPWDDQPFDLSAMTSMLRIFTPTTGNIVATITTAPAARERMEWIVKTNTPAFSRTSPALDTHGDRIMGYSMNGTPSFTTTVTTNAYEGETILHVTSTTGVKAGQFVLDTVNDNIANTKINSFTSNTITLDTPIEDTVNNGDVLNFFTSVPTYNIRYNYMRQTPYMAGNLTQPLAPTDTQIFVSVISKSLNSKLWDDNPLSQPISGKPGSIWINGERIEYFSLDRSGNNITLTGLRRATQGTTIAEQRVLVTGTGTGSSQTFTLDASNGIGPVEVRVDEKQYINFTTMVVGGNIDVTLTATIGSFITVAMTSGYDYSSGTPVYNASETFSKPVPIGPSVGNREIIPMHSIIAG